MGKANKNVQTWGIVPAAGVGRRMGRAKQLLPYRGSTLATTVARAVLDSGVSGVVVVTRTQFIDQLHLPDDPRIRIAINDDTDSEMIDSIRIALSALDELGANSHDGVLVVPADMPTLSCGTCQVCIEAFCMNPERIVIARYRGKRGHPIIFPFALRNVIQTLEGGLRMLPDTSAADVHYVDVDDAGIATDINRPAEYERLKNDKSAQGEEP